MGCSRGNQREGADSPRELPSLGTPRARCPRNGCSFPGCHGSTPQPGVTELTAKVRDAGQWDRQLSPVLPGLPQAQGPQTARG